MTLTRVVVDSLGWIEVFTGGGQAAPVLALMADAHSLVVPAIWPRVAEATSKVGHPDGLWP